jgi:hypothetical protein
MAEVESWNKLTDRYKHPNILGFEKAILFLWELSNPYVYWVKTVQTRNRGTKTATL